MVPGWFGDGAGSLCNGVEAEGEGVEVAVIGANFRENLQDRINDRYYYGGARSWGSQIDDTRLFMYDFVTENLDVPNPYISGETFDSAAQTVANLAAFSAFAGGPTAILTGLSMGMSVLRGAYNFFVPPSNANRPTPTPAFENFPIVPTEGTPSVTEFAMAVDNELKMMGNMLDHMITGLDEVLRDKGDKGEKMGQGFAVGDYNSLPPTNATTRFVDIWPWDGALRSLLDTNSPLSRADVRFLKEDILTVDDVDKFTKEEVEFLEDIENKTTLLTSNGINRFHITQITQALEART